MNPQQPHNVLVVEDEQRIRQIISRLLRSEGHAVLSAEDGETALKLLNSQAVDAVILDVRMPGINGLQTFRRMKKQGMTAPVIFLTAHGSIEGAVEAMKEGAFDYLTKPFANRDLLQTVSRALSGLSHITDSADTQAAIITCSPLMKALLDKTDKIAGTDSPVLITGESGTGKELLAKRLHAGSPRAAEPFVALNCGALPKDLVESELFGYRRGAFSGALRDKPGLVEQAGRGSLFLDEIGEMSTDSQAKLLRFTQSGEFIPVGGDRIRKVHPRLIAASNADLETEIQKGRFRSDLYFRLNVVNLEIPPLRQRSEDILPLAEHFLRQSVKEQPQARQLTISAEASQALIAHDWPGNVRELENAVRGAALLCSGTSIGLSDLPTALRKTSPDAEAFTSEPSLPKQVDQQQEALERVRIVEALRACEGNRTHAARKLGISRNTLLRKIQKYHLTHL